MITIKKILTLKPRVQLRKAGDIFHEAASACFDEEYLSSALSIILSSDQLDLKAKERIRYFYDRKAYVDIYYTVLDQLGESPADWDMHDEEGLVDWSKRDIRKHRLFLDHLRSPYNVGSIFRSAESFGIEEIIIAPGTASPEHPRAMRTSMGCTEGVRWRECELENLDKSIPVFALELGGKDISEFEFPEEGICIIGSEETGVSKDALEMADKSLGRVSIKQYGAKGSINVSSASAILMMKWMEWEERN